MKILLAASDNSKFSGAFRSMVRLAKHLQVDFGNEVQVLLPYEGNGTELLEENGIHYNLIRSYDWVYSKNIKSKSRYKKLIQYYCNIFVRGKIKQYLLKLKPDIVHINTSWCYIVGKVAEDIGIPVIWHIREFLDEDQNMTYINKNKAIKTYSRAKSVVCISEAILEKYLNYKLKNTKLIYNGIDSNIFEHDINHNILISDIINFVMIGRISEGKGQLWVIESFIKLVDQKVLNPEKFCLHLVGACNEDYIKQIKEKITKKNLIKCFDFAGTKNNVEKILNKSDCFIMNSKCEAFGRVTVEAMMAGCLVIGCDTGATPELIKNDITGILYRYKDFENFKDSIVKLLNNNLKYQSIAKQGQKISFEKFNSYTNAKNINELYIKVIEQENILKIGGGK